MAKEIIKESNELRGLVDLYERVLQKNRKAYDSRLKAIERGDDTASESGRLLLEKWFELFESLEDKARNDIEELCNDYPIIDLMVAVKGVGKLLAAKVVSMIDISRAEHVSSLWRYAGYGVNPEGERDKPVKGEKLCYNKRLKTTCYLVGASFLKSNSPYRRIYDSAREYYTANRPDWTEAHRHNAALRKMIKMWLSHLWLTWRKLEGLPTSEPYVQEKLGHTHIHTPQEFGWE